MKKSASTLSIRMKLPGEEETQRPEPQEEVVYLWDRIIITSVVAVLVVVAAAAGGWHWLAQPEPVQSRLVTVQTQAAAPVDVDSATLEYEAASPTDSIPPASSSPTPSPTTSSPPRSTLTAASPDHVTDAATPLPADTVAEKAPSQPVIKTLGLKKEANALRKAMIPEASAAEPVLRRSDQTVANKPSPALAKVEILSDHLLRAQLSNGMRDREPVDHAAAVIPMNKEGLVKVFFFTELQDLQGQTVYYDWFLGDKRMARVRARPQLESTQAYSSKFIDRHMLGQWQVKVQTDDGDMLARAEFEVR